MSYLRYSRSRTDLNDLVNLQYDAERGTSALLPWGGRHPREEGPDHGCDRPPEDAATGSRKPLLGSDVAIAIPGADIGSARPICDPTRSQPFCRLALWPWGHPACDEEGK